MKKFTLVSLTIFLLFGFLPQVSADSSVINLVSKPHQLFDGTFLNDDLATDLSPTGSLGKAVEQKRIKTRTWIIDAALLDEVADMADGYELASNEDGVGVEAASAWMEQLRIATVGDIITPITYGNPDIALAKRLAPSELSFYQSFGAQRVAFHLGRAISEDKTVFKSSASKLSGPDRKNYTVNRQAVSKLSTVVTAPELELFRARLAILLSSSINGASAKVFAASAIDGVVQQQNKLRVNPGKYALTSEYGKVPLTLVNGFTTPVKINLIFRASNIRVIVDDIREITLDPQSRTQMAVPYTVITSGNTQVNAVLTNSQGKWLGPSSKLALSMTLIDSRVAWFTTTAAVLLFIGAGAQTFRRIRKGRQ